MASKNNKDTDRFQHQLLELLKDESNRVCADCRARGPRWASWNLGVFICIRCAGMHRNLGVHIAKVKSVNLDLWTQEQVDNMLAWGNGVANEYYEYKLPSDFRRPSDDPGVDKFVRNKYEKKLYIHDNFDYANSIKNHGSGGASSSSGGVSVSSKVKRTSSKVQPAAVNAPVKSIPVVPLKTKSDAYIPPKVPARKPAPTKAAPAPSSNPPSLLQVSLDSTPPAPPTSVKPDLVDLFGDMVSAPAPPLTDPSQPVPPANLLQDGTEEPKQSVKDSIMSLYGSTAQAGFANSAGGTPNSQQVNGQFVGTMPPGPGGQFGMQPAGQYVGVMSQQGAQYAAQQQQQQQFANVQFRNGGVGMGQQQFGQQHMVGMSQQNMVGMGQQNMVGMQQQFVANPMFAGNQQFGQTNGQQQFNQLAHQQGNNAFGIHNGMGTASMQRMNNVQGTNNVQGMNSIQGVGNVQGMNSSMQGMNQGMFMNNMGGTPQQLSFNMGQVSATNQQQHFDNIQRQLYQLKVGQTQQSQPQAGWAQTFGSG